MKVYNGSTGNRLSILSNMNKLTETDIADRLSKSYNNSINNPYPSGFLTGTIRPAAVLIPLLKKRQAWHLLFIRRTENQGDPHGGQVAFPGGASDPDDDQAERTALREAQEEIGLDPKDVKILGRLNDFLTITGYRVTPVIGLIPWPYVFKPAWNEVSRIFTIPLNWLNDPSNLEVKKRELPEPFQSIPVNFYKPYQGEVLWGASAGFTIELLKILRLSNSN